MEINKTLENSHHSNKRAVASPSRSAMPSRGATPSRSPTLSRRPITTWTWGPHEPKCYHPLLLSNPHPLSLGRVFGEAPVGARIWVAWSQDRELSQTFSKKRRTENFQKLLNQERICTTGVRPRLSFSLHFEQPRERIYISKCLNRNLTKAFSK